jgi:DNA repair exonuclease SbcCD nuclease subunit
VPKKLTKTASFTDIHWGARGNSEQHNIDCMNYIDWFCYQVKQDKTIDSIVFMGDWFENRSALNISTMNYSYLGAKKINDLGLPVFFIVGNHDLYQRNSRDVFSTIHFHEFSNFTIITEPTVIENLGDGNLLCPFLFHNEYPTLTEFLNLKTWWGHFEFQGFKVTGTGMKMPTGPDAKDFTGPKHIFSGHFHARQQDKNIIYIGNTFPTNFSDAGDNERGMMVYDHIKHKPVFHDWDECPKFIKTSLSAILDGTITMHNGARVKCVVDVPITFEESMNIRQQFIDAYNLREFVLEESGEIAETLTNEEEELEDIPDVDLKSVDELEQYNRLSND